MKNCNHLLYTSRDQMMQNYIAMMKDYCINLTNYIYEREKDNYDQEARYSGLKQTEFYFDEKRFTPYKIIDHKGNTHILEQKFLGNDKKDPVRWSERWEDRILYFSSYVKITAECQAGTIYISISDFPKEKIGYYLCKDDEHLENEYFCFYDGSGITVQYYYATDSKKISEIEEVIYKSFTKYGFYYESSGPGDMRKLLCCDDQSMYTKTTSIDVTYNEKYGEIKDKWKELLMRDKDYKEGEYSGYVEFKNRNSNKLFIIKSIFISDKPFCYLESSDELEKYINALGYDFEGIYSRKMIEDQGELYALFNQYY